MKRAISLMLTAIMLLSNLMVIHAEEEYYCTLYEEQLAPYTAVSSAKCGMSKKNGAEEEDSRVARYDSKKMYDGFNFDFFDETVLYAAEIIETTGTAITSKDVVEFFDKSNENNAQFTYTSSISLRDDSGKGFSIAQYDDIIIISFHPTADGKEDILYRLSDPKKYFDIIDISSVYDNEAPAPSDPPKTDTKPTQEETKPSDSNTNDGNKENTGSNTNATNTNTSENKYPKELYRDILKGYIQTTDIKGYSMSADIDEVTRSCEYDLKRDGKIDDKYYQAFSQMVLGLMSNMMQSYIDEEGEDFWKVRQNRKCDLDIRYEINSEKYFTIKIFDDRILINIVPDNGTEGVFRYRFNAGVDVSSVIKKCADNYRIMPNDLYAFNEDKDSIYWLFFKELFATNGFEQIRFLSEDKSQKLTGEYNAKKDGALTAVYKNNLESEMMRVSKSIYEYGTPLTDGEKKWNEAKASPANGYASELFIKKDANNEVSAEYYNNVARIYSKTGYRGQHYFYFSIERPLNYLTGSFMPPELCEKTEYSTKYELSDMSLFDYDKMTYDGKPMKYIDKIKFHFYILGDGVINTYKDKLFPGIKGKTVNCEITQYLFDYKEADNRAPLTRHIYLLTFTGDNCKKTFWTDSLNAASRGMVFYLNKYIDGKRPVIDDKEEKMSIRISGSGYNKEINQINISFIPESQNKHNSKYATATCYDTKYEYIDEIAYEFDENVFDRVDNINLFRRFEVYMETNSNWLWVKAGQTAEEVGVAPKISKASDPANKEKVLQGTEIEPTGKSDTEGESDTKYKYDYQIVYILRNSIDLESADAPQWYKEIGQNVTVDFVGIVTQVYGNNYRTNNLLRFKGDKGIKWFINNGDDFIENDGESYTSVQFMETKSFDGKKIVMDEINAENVDVNVFYDDEMNVTGVNYYIGGELIERSREECKYVGGGKKFKENFYDYYIDYRNNYYH